MSSSNAAYIGGGGPKREQGFPTHLGFPISEESATGSVDGYHCWVQVALPDQGWFPVDASVAARNPERKDALFGRQPADRIRFTVGRDLVLDGQKTPPLNFFVYPHVEVAGKVHEGVKTTFSYRPVQGSDGGSAE